MELRRKFSIIALIYLAALAANLALAAWCILVYFSSAFAAFDTELAREREVEELQAVVRRQAALLQAGGPPDEVARTYDELQAFLTSGLEHLAAAPDHLGDSRQTIEETLAAKNEAARLRLAELASPDHGRMTAATSEAFAELDDVLGGVRSVFNESRLDQVERAATTQSRVITILVASTCLGAALCGIGLLSMRRWVVRPIGELREATRRISRGQFDYRLPVESQDELGRLAAEVNQMCSTIQDMQRRLIEQERLAAAGEMFARLAHNIRNPLGRIRGLAEATVQQRADDPETVDCQRRIISTVDRFEKWLRDMQQSVSPMSLNLQPVRVTEPIESVATALDPLFDRRGVKLEVHIDPRINRVLLDAAHFEQGLVALVTNAIQASAPGQQVRIRVGPVDTDEGKWQIAVEDDGPGISAEIRERIFLPCFTTKPDGHGLGLAMANKVVKIHGGNLTFDSSSGQGTRFIAVLPGRIRERD